MAKKGGTKHMKRIAVPNMIGLTNKKAFKWMARPSPGPHCMKKVMPLSVLLKDVLGVAKTFAEAKMLAKKRMVLVDGRVRTDEKFPVGVMDVVAFPKSGKVYRIIVNHKGQLIPQELDAANSNKKLLKVVRKQTVKKGKFILGFHDGRNLSADKHIRVGDSVLYNVKDSKIEKVLSLQTGSHCLITEGKHAGKVAVLKEIIQRAGSRKSEARMKAGEESFITVADYLFVVDNSYKGV